MQMDGRTIHVNFVPCETFVKNKRDIYVLILMQVKKNILYRMLTPLDEL